MAKTHFMSSSVLLVKLKHSVVLVSKDHPVPMENPAPMAKMENQELVQVHPVHQDPMQNSTIVCCQYHHNAHVKLLLEWRDRLDHQDKMVLPDNRVTTETTEHLDRKVL